MTYTLTLDQITMIGLMLVGALGLALLAALTDKDGNLRIR